MDDETGLTLPSKMKRMQLENASTYYAHSQEAKVLKIWFRFTHNRYIQCANAQDLLFQCSKKKNCSASHREIPC